MRFKKQQFDSKHRNVTRLVRPPLRSRVKYLKTTGLIAMKIVEMTSLDFPSSEEMMAMRVTFLSSTSIGWIALKFDAQDAFSKPFKNKTKVSGI